MRLQVQSKAGIPNFSISTSPEDDVAALTSSAAEHAKLKTSDIRLSHAGRLLESRDRVEALGLADGDMLLMHVRSTGQQPAAHHSYRVLELLHTLKGSFSAVSKPNFAIKYTLESSRRDLHNALLCTVLVGSV